MLSLQYLFTLSGSSGVKAVRKTKLSPGPGVNFTNILREADPKSDKETDGLTLFFALLGSARAKAAHIRCW
jgi:hypothetical protein